MTGNCPAAFHLNDNEVELISTLIPKEAISSQDAGTRKDRQPNQNVDPKELLAIHQRTIRQPET